MSVRIALQVGAIALLLLAGLANAQDSYSPHAGVDYPQNLYWGDTHVHSAWSPDAGGAGNERLEPEDAFRFARGEEITAHNGQKIRLRRPLDFLLVSDHSEYLGLYPMLEEEFPSLIATETGARWRNFLQEGRRSRIGAEFALSLAAGKDLVGDRSFVGAMWQRVIDHAERANDPGRFTAFIGYEWTSMPGGANLHRNVLFRDGADRTRQIRPFSSIESADPEALWEFFASYEEKTGGRVMAIPHNSNLSAGRMFEQKRFNGEPLTRAYAESRTRWERIVEATQIKGDSEAAPFLSPDDEFADFGTWDFMRGMMPTGEHEDWMYEGEYVRPALGRGLALGRALGANPFQFGLIGSTDAHTSMATADDDNFWGKFSNNEPYSGRAEDPWARFEIPDAPEFAAYTRSTKLPEGLYTWNLVASGYAAVWAHENTRASLFDAMDRRETYSTTGPRISIRFFGGWGFEEGDASKPDVAAIGYAGGVPMGGELPAMPAQNRKGSEPSFLVSALRDPEGAHLDRVQIVKLWVDAKDGKVRERIHDVAVSDGRRIERDGRCKKPVGNTVDVATATYTNAIGDAQLATVWRDPDFEASQAALYYLRVLEIPTPRWTTYDVAHFGGKPPSAVPATHQERAYTSPIWYSPEP
ncbi:MAG: DUF3604 domain-containing protein [bacterium]|nr:hypothetical protein [Deltaproteobacteria bacterium]MCP4907452.1 DUF3604 domain-containing protein [bacterium]